MSRYTRPLSHFLCALALCMPLLAAADSGSADAALTQALKGAWRDPANAARDRYRHPKETLGFFGLQPNMTVVELWPGAGWYTEVLAPVLHDHGQLVEAALPPKGFGESDNTQRLLDKMAADKDVYGKVQMIDFAPPGKLSLGKDGSADMVLTFRNAHNWEGEHQLLVVFQSAFKVLKHGGVLGLTDHRAAPGTTVDQVFKSGYMPVDYIIRTAEKAGFKLAGQSEINANPKDDRDHPKGVWTLPPTYAMSDTDRGKYAAIGESDRMTLKFVKP